jgi:predicted dehydrogenase
MNDQVGIAVLGCGYWGINYVRLFEELPGARVVVACDPREERLLEVRRRFPNVEVTASVEHAIGHPDVRAAVICSEASHHFSLCRRCLLTSRHVLVEKPITTTSAQAEVLIDMAEARRLTLMVGHTFIYNSGVRKVKEYLQRGRAGKIYYIYATRTNLGPFRKDVNALWDLAPHDVAICNYLLEGSPDWVSAVGARVLGNGHEDVGFVSLGYPGGVVAHVHASWTDPHKAREVVVVGSKGRIVFNDLNGVEQVRVYKRGVAPIGLEPSSYGEYRLQIRDGDITSPKVEVTEPLKNQCRHFLECVTAGQRPLSGGREGRQVVKVLEAVDRSLKLRGAPVQIWADGEEGKQEERHAGNGEAGTAGRSESPTLSVTGANSARD